MFSDMQSEYVAAHVDRNGNTESGEPNEEDESLEVSYVIGDGSIPWATLDLGEGWVHGGTEKGFTFGGGSQSAMYFTQYWYGPAGSELAAETALLKFMGEQKALGHLRAFDMDEFGLGMQLLEEAS
jgi:hypothetical protein